MPGMYRLKNLLEVVSEQGAHELRLEPDCPPTMMLRGKLRVLDNPVITSDQISELLGGIITPEQRHELELCGSIRFTLVADHSPHFRVHATMRREQVSIIIKNLDAS